MGRPRKPYASAELEKRRASRRESAKKWYANNKERALKWQNEYYAVNKTRILTASRDRRKGKPISIAKQEYNRKWHEAHPGYRKAHFEQYRLKNATKLKQQAIDWHYRKNYGFDHAKKMEMLALQGGVCAICREVPQRSCVDHDHETGAIREILCLNCNTALGHFDDDIPTMEAAIAYVAKHSASQRKLRA